MFTEWKSLLFAVHLLTANTNRWGKKTKKERTVAIYRLAFVLLTFSSDVFLETAARGFIIAWAVKPLSCKR